ncbi:MAG TPA: alpha/beta hydrolase [Candidatus Dojkabacteria bacterium]|nr:alpha/beta hydrolase [Candidatus Dojkabacteria bacterium]
MGYKYLDVGGVNLPYLDEGEGNTIFLIPPWAASSVAFEGLREMLVKDGNRVISVDLPGWGARSKDLLVDKDFDNYIDIVEKFIKSFDIKVYNVLGYSLGATFLLHLLAQKRITPDKFILVSGFHSRKNIFELDSKLKKNTKIFEVFKRRGWSLSYLKFFVKMSYFIELFVNPPYLLKGWYYMRLIFFDAMKGDIDSAITPMFTLKDIDVRSLEGFRGKPLVIYNRNEPWYFRQFSEEIADMFNTEPSVVDGYSHRHLSFEPEKAYNVIKDFIK